MPSQGAKRFLSVVARADWYQDVLAVSGEPCSIPEPSRRKAATPPRFAYVVSPPVR
ncbi:hypothetical protein ACFPYM_00925 [Methylobacterium hispanicum]